MKRAIQQSIENPLAQDILQGKFTTGDTIVVSVKDDRFVFEKSSTGKPSAVA